MTSHRSRLYLIVIDVNDLERATRFWCAALNANVDPSLENTPGVYQRLQVPGEDIRTTTRSRTLQITSIASLAGAPCVSLPLTRVQGLPIGISVIGAPGSDEHLLRLAVEAGTITP